MLPASRVTEQPNRSLAGGAPCREEGGAVGRDRKGQGLLTTAVVEGLQVWATKSDCLDSSPISSIYNYPICKMGTIHSMSAPVCQLLSYTTTFARWYYKIKNVFFTFVLFLRNNVWKVL